MNVKRIISSFLSEVVLSMAYNFFFSSDFRDIRGTFGITQHLPRHDSWWAIPSNAKPMELQEEPRQ